MIVLDLKDARPLYEQIVERFKHLILCGALPEDEKLPSVRNLAMELSINPNTIQKAFQELDRNGIIVSGQGRGCFVAQDADRKIRERLSSKIFEIESIAAELACAGIEEEKVTQAVHRAYASWRENFGEKGMANI